MKKLSNYFKNKKVLITGHTGFKGSWLTFWLSELGAKILGISNNFRTDPSLFNILQLKKKITHKELNINNYKKFKKEILKFKPDYIFHLAAQSIVKESYSNPKATFETNTFGTLNLLESLKFLKKKCNVVIITSDKSYKNLEIKRGYRENDTLGGDDPYSASKAAAELVINSYTVNYFKNNSRISLVVARAGNVIGGGDWSSNRLIPDCVKSWSKNKKAILRSPDSTRPWQHVLEVIFGYILLSISLKRKKIRNQVFNLGPKTNQIKSVIQLVNEFKKCWNNISWVIKKRKNFFEHKLLKLNSEKIKKNINWECILTFKETIQLTADWYKDFYFKKNNIFNKTIDQLNFYQKKIKNFYF